MNYDRPYMSYRDQINHLKSNYGLVISNEDIAISLLSSLSYYDLINGYKQCFMDNEKYFPGTTIEDLYEFYSIDKTIQNLLFKYSIAVENRFKTILSNNISYNFGVDVLNYLDKKNFKKPNSKRLDKVINDLNKIINSKYCPNPTRHYKETKNHIPPWILFKNATFNTSIDYFVELEDSMRDSISKEIYTRGFNASSYSDFITSSLKIVKKFRNVIAHNLNFINTRTSDRLILKNVASEYFGTLTSRKDIRLNIGINDPYSMIISIITLLDEDFLIKEFVFDFVRSVMIIKNDRPKDLINKYFEFTNIPTDFENRFLNYLLKIDCKF